MTKTFPEVISGIRTAKKGVEVREDIAQMGEYVEQFASTATTKASEAEKSAERAKNAVEGIDQQKADAVKAVQQAQATAATAVTETKNAALQEVSDATADAKNAASAAGRYATSANTSASAASGSASAAEQAKAAAATSASKAAGSATSAATSEEKAKFYSEAAKDVIDQSAKDYAGGYSRTFTLIAPQAAWTALETPVGIYNYYVDVTLADCTDKWNAFAAVLPESYLIGYKARVANVIDTQNGSVRLYAVNAPDGDIKFVLSVFAVGSHTYYLTVPASGWEQNTSTTGNDLWQSNVTLEDSSSRKVPMGMVALENTEAAFSHSGFSATMETFDGYIRVYAKNRPTVDVNIIVILLARNEVN